LRWLELRQTELRSDVLPDNLYGHFTSHLTWITANDIGKEMLPFLKLNDCNYVREITFKGRMVGLMVHDKGEDLPFAARNDPLGIIGMAKRAYYRGWPADMTAIRALLKSKLMALAAVPKLPCVSVHLG
jgi:hypothetical protein